MNAIDELIEAQQKVFEQESVSRAERELAQIEKERREVEVIKDFVIQVIGADVWKELEPYAHWAYYNGWVTFRFETNDDLALSPFDLSSNGATLTLSSFSTEGKRISNRENMAASLHWLRKTYLEWFDRKKAQEEQEKLAEVYRSALKAWEAEVGAIRAKNKCRLDEAQRRVPSFVVYDLTVLAPASFAADGSPQLEMQHIPVLDRDPDDQNYWPVVEQGKVVRRRFYQLYSLDVEGVLIAPGEHDQKFPGVCGKVFLENQNYPFYFGPYIDPLDYLPELIDEADECPERPEPPAELDENLAVQIERELDPWVW